MSINLPATSIPRFKSVEWAYPTSITATRCGYAKTGCWVVQISCSHPTLEAVYPYATREAALADARELVGVEWENCFKHIYPEDAID